MVNKLALLGGDPIRQELFPAYNTIGKEEEDAAVRVIRSGILSEYLGAWHDDFYGGTEVRAFEKEWADAYQAKHAVSVNSATSGLYVAVGAAGVGPGDEVIVSPYTMIASATSALVFNGVPVFADVDPGTFNISPATIEPAITKYTKAIVVVHLFGQPADMDGIMALAKKHSLIVIEDCAQVPFASYKGRPVGTLGHMGVFSLNYHKHIHTGEGGVVTTNDDDLAERMRLIRNHAEAVVARKGTTNLVNMIGFNFRLGEIECAMGRTQLQKGHALVDQRRENVGYLEERLKGLPGLKPAPVLDGVEHSYYVHPLLYNRGETGVSRALYVDAIKAELPATSMREKHGVLIGGGYVRPLYWEPIFQEMVGYGDKQCPFKCPHYEGNASYERGLCPNVEEAHLETLITHEMMRPGMSHKDLDDVAQAFEKVSNHLDDLRVQDL